MAYHSRAIGCELCGQQFFPSSLPFHVKQCAIKQQFVPMPCPHCDKAVLNCDMQRHISRECKAVQKSNSTSVVSRAGVAPCSVCGRRFASDRLLKHQTICRRNSASSSVRVATKFSPEPVEPTNWRELRNEMKAKVKLEKSRPSFGNVKFQLVLGDQENVVDQNISSSITRSNWIADCKRKNQLKREVEFVIVTKEGMEQVGPSADGKENEWHRGEPMWVDDSLEPLLLNDDSLEIDHAVGISQNESVPKVELPLAHHTDEKKPAATAWAVDWDSQPKKFTGKASSPPYLVNLVNRPPPSSPQRTKTFVSPKSYFQGEEVPPLPLFLHNSSIRFN